MPADKTVKRKTSRKSNISLNKPTQKTDPLYTIFEQHLFNFQDPNSDRKSFIEGIVNDYLSQMRRMGFGIPSEWEIHIREELSFQVNTMLVKKIYGCLSINEYQEKLTPVQKRTAKDRYQKLQSVKKAA